MTVQRNEIHQVQYVDMIVHTSCVPGVARGHGTLSSRRLRNAPCQFPSSPLGHARARVLALLRAPHLPKRASARRGSILLSEGSSSTGLALWSHQGALASFRSVCCSCSCSVCSASLWNWRRLLALLPCPRRSVRRVQSEGCVAEPLQTITAILPGSK